MTKTAVGGDDPGENEPVPDEVAEILDELEREDKLTAEAVVAKAADPDSPAALRDYIFNCDDAEAAYQHRLERARALIRRPRIVYADDSGKTTRYRRTVFVESEGIYKNTDRALRENRDEVLAQCRREFETFRRKFGHLKEFDRIIRGEAA